MLLHENIFFSNCSFLVQITFCCNYRVADPGGIAPDPDPTFKEKTGSGSDRQEEPDPDPTLEKDPDPQPWL